MPSLNHTEVSPKATRLQHAKGLGQPCGPAARTKMGRRNLKNMRLEDFCRNVMILLSQRYNLTII